MTFFCHLYSIIVQYRCYDASPRTCINKAALKDGLPYFCLFILPWKPITQKLTKTDFFDDLGEVTFAKLDMFIIVVKFNHNQSKSSVDGSVAVEAATVAIGTGV